jgi:hypothetical protein
VQPAQNAAADRPKYQFMFGPSVDHFGFPIVSQVEIRAICPLANQQFREVRGQDMARKTIPSIISNGKKKTKAGKQNQRGAGKQDVELGKRMTLT